MATALRVLAVGAAGPFAGLVVPELRARGAEVRGLIHKAEDESKAREHGASEIALGELGDKAAVAAALRGMDAAFYLAPVAIKDEAAVGRRFVELARAAGVRRIVFSSVIHPVLSTLENHAAKAPVEEALVESGLEYVLLHPAIFFQTMAEGFAKARESGVYGEPWSNETRFSRVDYRDVAEVAAKALCEDELVYGTFELAAEGALNRVEVAALMAEVLGRPVEAKKTPPPPNAPEQLQRMFTWYDRHALRGNATTLRAILGREPRTLRDYLSELAR